MFLFSVLGVILGIIYKTMVGIKSPLIHFGETLLRLSLLVTGRDSGLWVELSLKTDSRNPLESFVKLLKNYSKTESCSLPGVGQYWTELSK